MVEHFFNPSTQEAEGGIGRHWEADICEFQASLIYTASSRTAIPTQRDSVSKIKKTSKTKQKAYFFFPFKQFYRLMNKDQFFELVVESKD